MSIVHSHPVPIKWETPDPFRPAQTRPRVFIAWFCRVPHHELRQLYDAGGEVAVLRSVLADWSALIGPDGLPVPFTESARDRLLDNPAFRDAIGQAWCDFALPHTPATIH